MTREQLEARKAQAMQDKANALAVANMAEGVIQDCDYWLAQLDAEEKASESVKE